MIDISLQTLLDGLNNSHSHDIDPKFIFRADRNYSFIDIAAVQPFNCLYDGLEVDEIFGRFNFINFCDYDLDIYVVVVAPGNKLQIGLF